MNLKAISGQSFNNLSYFDVIQPIHCEYNIHLKLEY